MNLHDANDLQFFTPDNPCEHCDPDDPVEDCWHCPNCGYTEFNNTFYISATREVSLDPAHGMRDEGDLEEDSVETDDGWECSGCGNQAPYELETRLRDWY